MRPECWWGSDLLSWKDPLCLWSVGPNSPDACNKVRSSNGQGLVLATYHLKAIRASTMSIHTHTPRFLSALVREHGGYCEGLGK